MFSKVNTAVCIGVEGRNVQVETDISNGLPAINIVGLASTTVMEAKERIKTAIINSDYEYPRLKITINLTPANLRKNGSYLDLPIAIGLLASSGYVNCCKAVDYGVIGELSLDGEVLGVDGVLPMVLAMHKFGLNKIIVPETNYYEALFVEGCEIIPIRNLYECVEAINGSEQYKNLTETLIAQTGENNNTILDYEDIKGQENAKRAITIAVTGRHGLLMIGTPGCGKSMLAKRIPTIMPPMSRNELIELSIIKSVVGANNVFRKMNEDRPFRAPHNSIGKAGLLGGGNVPIPGEISLAHNGVLFLDEVCEFDRNVIESLRVPIEEKSITHFRNGFPYTFPCNFQLVMASNPCPCGYYGDAEKLCKCSEVQIENYRKKLSGPMMDRIDMKIQMEKVSYKEMTQDYEGESSSSMRASVLKGVNFAKTHKRHCANADMSENDINKYCVLGEAEKNLLQTAYNNLKLSPRSYKKVLKVARTIADLDESEFINTNHIAEALSYRISNDY